ncbi:hypothetical protein BDR07DRAFT_1374352 [Suillus spraguei]|nr:hypothetical protein BDR07DRAFT_1374352 [Suillus spraguei]
MSEDGKPKFSWKWSPQESCVLKHSAICKKLPVHLQSQAITASKDGSLGVQILEDYKTVPDNEGHLDEPLAKWPKNQEAVFVRQWQLKELKKHNNLTLTFDGTSTQKPQSLYTVHATTPDQITHFLDGHEDSTTIYDVGEDKWAAICSDSTAVTKNAQCDVVNTIPTILDLCDTCHHLHNTIKNVTQLPEFEQMLSLLKPIIKHFSKSTISAAHLWKEQ